MKRTVLTRGSAVMLILMAAFGLTGCTKANRQPAIPLSELMSMMNQSVDHAQNDLISAVDWTAFNGQIWSCGYQKGGTSDPEKMETWITCANTDGSQATATQLTFEPDAALLEKKAQLAGEDPKRTYYLVLALHSILPGSAETPRLILQEQLLAVDTEKNTTVAAQQYTLCSLSADGSPRRDALLQWPQDLNSQAISYDRLSPLEYFLADDGSLWVNLQGDTSDGDTVAGCYLRFDASGACTARLELPDKYRTYNSENSMQLMPDGDLLLFAHSTDGGHSLFIIHAPTKEKPTLSGPLPLQTTSNTLNGFITALSGTPGEEVFIHTDKGVIQCDLSTGTSTVLLEWDIYGVLLNQDVTRAMFFYPKNATTQFLRIGAKSGTSILSVIDEEALAQLPTITVALPHNSDIGLNFKTLIHAYNAAGNDHYIKAVDFSPSAAQAAGFSSSKEMLNQAIIDNTAPDILLLNGVEVANYVRKGLFVDLYPYMDADPDLNRSDFVPSILTACEYNGQLPTVAARYSLLTAVGDTNVVGDKMGLTWNAYNDLLATYPQAVPIFNYSRDAILNSLLKAGGSKFIDTESGRAYLDTPAFVQLLEVSAGYPVQGSLWNEDGTPLNPKEPLTTRQALLNLAVISSFRQILEQEYIFDGQVTFVGFPNDDNTNGALITPIAHAGITSTCQNPDAAWDFLRTMLLPAYQNNLQQLGFPLRLDSLQALAQASMQWEETAATPAYLPSVLPEEQMEYWQQGLTQEQIDQVMALISSSTILSSYDGTISSVVREEASAFYSGARTAEEAAAIMQNRVQTYLDEQG